MHKVSGHFGFKLMSCVVFCLSCAVVNTCCSALVSTVCDCRVITIFQVKCLECVAGDLFLHGGEKVLSSIGGDRVQLSAGGRGTARQLTLFRCPKCGAKLGEEEVELSHNGTFFNYSVGAGEGK